MACVGTRSDKAANQSKQGSRLRSHGKKNKSENITERLVANTKFYDSNIILKQKIWRKCYLHKTWRLCLP